MMDRLNFISNKYYLNLILACLLLLASKVVQGDDGGSDRAGGGNAIVCFDNEEIPKRLRESSDEEMRKIIDSDLSHISKIEMLDYYNAKLIKTKDILTGKLMTGDSSIVKPIENETYENYSQRIINNWAPYFPTIYEKLKAGKDALASNTFFSKHGIKSINDTRILFEFDRKNCVIATMAIQDINNNSLYIDDRLFSHPKHSLISKAFLMQHEYFYNDLLQKGAKDSSGVMHILSKLFRVGTQNSKEIIDAASKVGLLTNDDEKLNSFQIQIKEAYSNLNRELEEMTKIFWYKKNKDVVDEYYGNKISDIIDDLQKLKMKSSVELRCYTLFTCATELKDYMSIVQDKDLIKEAQRILEFVTPLVSSLSIGARTFDSIEIITHSFFQWEGLSLWNDRIAHKKAIFKSDARYFLIRVIDERNLKGILLFGGLFDKSEFKKNLNENYLYGRELINKNYNEDISLYGDLPFSQ